MSRTPCAALIIMCMTALGPSSLAGERVGVREPQPRSGGIPPCPAGADKNFLSDEARACWFKAAHGRWRILAGDGHYDTLVYHVSAVDPADAIVIARRLVSGKGQPLGELLLYVYSEPLDKSARIRRVKWDAKQGYATIDFNGRVPPWMMPVQP